MQKKTGLELYKNIENGLCEKQFLKKIRTPKKFMGDALDNEAFREDVRRVAGAMAFDCEGLLKMSMPVLEKFSSTPEEGWLKNIYDHVIRVLFPNKVGGEDADIYYKGRMVLLQILRAAFAHELKNQAFSPIKSMKFPEFDEIRDCQAAGEYKRFIKLCNDNYIYEFMRIGQEITPYNTLGHIAGVHFTAMHVARQMAKAGAPVDIALVSAAAAAHDVGKYGCRDFEAGRTPYLHYYYTDQCLREYGMPLIAHIASNHSTWDLELENLSAEALILIYADFRVKNGKDADGCEMVRFYTLEQAFEVILGKLDNVDRQKRRRYDRVYAKLKDFEEYMISLGVNTDLASSEIIAAPKVDSALQSAAQVVNTLKYLAIEHNLNLMSKFNSEASFGSLLEAARSEKQWKSIRAYVNIFDEYSTYMTQKQKLMLLHFLYELLMHREGDIRRQAAALMGSVLADYDEEYRKELPEGVVRRAEETSSLELWDKYLGDIVFPDHRVVEQHKRWLGYTLKIVLNSILTNCKEADQGKYIGILMGYFRDTEIDDSTAFVILDSMLFIPLGMCEYKDVCIMMRFAGTMSKRQSEEIRIAVLRFIKYLSEYHGKNLNKELAGQAEKICRDMEDNYGTVSVVFLKYKIMTALGAPQGLWRNLEKKLHADSKGISDIFLENLKVGTPWVIKAVNIELLLDRLNTDTKEEILHVATHLSNLLKVSERVTVRHTAGAGLLAVASRLPLDQRNEVVIELSKGLEIGEYQFSKYIPEYLGELALYLHPNELDEVVCELRKMLDSNNDKVASVTLDTIGVLIKKYPEYRCRFPESESKYEARRGDLLGMLMKGLSNYNPVVSQEAFLVIGQNIFGSEDVSREEKHIIFKKIYKKMLTLITEQKKNDLSFFNNATALNHIYRFISDYALAEGTFNICETEKVAFFPGTFDPFSLSHKGIVEAIKDLGFEVYLALDEFSWSKKTQPRMQRRQIISMSVADTGDVYLFPDDIPVNIANSKDLRGLRNLFPGKDIYIVVGSDVIINASSYKAEPAEDSIHSFNHVVFRRSSMVEGGEDAESLEEACKNILGKLVELKLPMHLEDISSTRIRENIDYNRDISNLIDPVAQNYIYDNNLYLREPQYKLVMQTKTLKFEEASFRGSQVLGDLIPELTKAGQDVGKIKAHLDNPEVRSIVIRDGQMNNQAVAIAAIHEIDTMHLYEEFENLETATYIRENSSGKVVVIGGIYFSDYTTAGDIIQLILTETLASCLREDFAYGVYHPVTEGDASRRIAEVLERQGFVRRNFSGTKGAVFTVNMKYPITLQQDIETALKEPFDRNPKVLAVMDSAHKNMQQALTQLYPGNLVLSFNSGVIHHKLVNMITKENNVPSEPLEKRRLGAHMCVPFGKILKGMVVPNTITKTLHTEKQFDAKLSKFTIEEYPFYSPILNQAKTIKSFDKPVILVDDLLHKGYRMKKLDNVFKENEIDVSEIIVGILSGRGKDLMTIQGRNVDSAYFIPNLRAWFVESAMYPFIGGDSVKREESQETNSISSINLILPYAAPTFISDAPREAVYNFSMVCLENARRLLLALEEEYQNIFERKLTLKRLGEAVLSPRYPDKGLCVTYDFNLAPSVYVLNDIERLIRLKNIIT